MRIGAALSLALVLLARPVPADPAGEPDALAPLPASEWTVDKAAHLLRRAGFGGTVEATDELFALGLEGAVDRLLDWSGPDPDAPDPGISVTYRPGRTEMRKAATQEERREIYRAWRRKDQFQYARIREWWMQHMIRTRHPARERLVLFLHGHFTSGYRDVRNSYHMYLQNTLFRRHAAGSFRTLLHEVTKDPAMLEYLDNRSNRRGQPNENYAREVMELFTLGAGHYTEKDIKEAARALTGWTFVGNTFVEDPRQHDPGEKTIFGKTAAFDGTQFLDLLLAQPAAPRHIATKLYRYYAHDFPDDRVVAGLARTLLRSEWRLEPVLHRLFVSRAFYSPHAMGTKVKGPVEFLVGLFRSLGMDPGDHFGLSGMAAALGQTLLDPPNVKGWPGGREWITTSHLLNRYNLAGGLVGLRADKQRAFAAQGGQGRRFMRLAQLMRRADPNGEEMEGMGMGGDMSPQDARDVRRGTYQPESLDVLKIVIDRALTEPEEIVDHFCRALLANPPAPAMRATLLEYLARDGGFSLTRRDATARLHGLLRLIVSSPEFQLT